MQDKKLTLVVLVIVVLAAILVGGLFIDWSDGTVVPGKRIPMSEALERMNNGEKVVLLDVRTPEEYGVWRIPGSTLVPLDVAEKFGPAVERIVSDRNATIFLYCRSGRRSQTAADIMAQLGYRNAVNIGGVLDHPEGRE